jgi:Fis family transcriptional regulator, factor for inversion stimulation protein
MNTATFKAPTIATPSTQNFNQVAQQQSLRGCVEQAMENYFKHLDGQPVSDVYEMVMAEVEAPMLEIVLKYTRHNQTRAAHVLGLNRGTLRKKLKQYGLL